MKMLTKTSLPALSLLLLASCVSDSGSSSKKETGPTGINQNETIEADGSNVQGFYSAPVWPMNYNLHFKEIGMVGVSRQDDTFTVASTFKYGPKETTVKQALYTGRRCPNLTDDINRDAYVDILEARLAMGKITIPFDADLDSQSGGSNQYPTVDAAGKMFYSKTASFSRMFEDLKDVDQNPADQIIKLENSDGITLPGRIVLFQGVPKKVTLPETVATVDGEDRNTSLPVGCAVLWKVDAWPSELTSTLPTPPTTTTGFGH